MFYLNNIHVIVFSVFLSQRSSWIMPSKKSQIEDIDVQVARAFLLKLTLAWKNRLSESDIFSMSSNR